MAKKQHNESESQEGLRERIGLLVKEHTLRGLARKVEVFPQNIDRYLQGTKIPASFCQALVSKLGVDPAWLLTGEGQPSRANVGSSTETTGSELFELVTAMNEVSRMRIGALTGKDQLSLLRGLSDALTRYKELRESQQKYAHQVFEQVVANLAAALNQDELDLAESLVKTGEQVVEMAGDRHLAYEFNRALAGFKNRTGDQDTVVETLYEILHYSLTSGQNFSERACEDAALLANGLQGQLRFLEALEICKACTALAERRGSDWTGFHAIQMTMGLLYCQLGQAHRGHSLLLKAHLKLPQEIQQRRSTHLLACSMFLNGTMTFEQMQAYGNFPPALLVPFALWTEDATYLKSMMESVDTYGGKEGLRLRAPLHYLDVVHKALTGHSDVLALFDDGAKKLTKKASFANYLRMTMPVIRTQVALMTGNASAAWRSAQKAEAVIAEHAPEVMLPVIYRGIHYRNVLRIVGETSQTKEKRILQDTAIAFFQEAIDNGCGCFSEVLSDPSIE